MYLCFSMSNSVTQEEWEKVYEESLFLADKLNLADWIKFYYKGIRHYAYCKVKEQTDEDDGKVEHFWKTCAEYVYMYDGEYLKLNRELNKYKYNENARPAIITELESYNNSFDKEITHHVTRTWGGTYFVRVLAIMCLLESRLKEKVYIYGDIIKQDCESAVKMANQYLKEPIEIPARCDYNRLYEIVKTIDISEEEKISLIHISFLGNTDLQFRKFVTEKFDKKVIDNFWKNKFKDLDINSYDFESTLKTYLSYGFDFKDLFLYIPKPNTKEDCLKLLELIIKIELFKDDLTKSIGLTRNPKDNSVTGFSLEFRRSLFGPDFSIDTHYSFDDYVNEFSKYFGNLIDVRNFLKEQIKEEDEDSLLKKVKTYCKRFKYLIFEGEENYDIILSRNLMYYKPGDKIAPYLLKDIKKELKTNKKRLSDKKFKELEKKEPTEQIYELIDIYAHFSAREIDWQHAIDYFHTHTDALQRYYPLFNMDFGYFKTTEDIAKALFINDDFYEFCKSLLSE